MMGRQRQNLLATLLIAVLVGAAGVAGGALAANKLSFFAAPVQTNTVTSTSEIVTAVEKREEIVLLSTASQGLHTVQKEARLFNFDVPASQRTNILQYRYTAKLGIDGREISIEETAPANYLVHIPVFKIIGLDDPEFKTVHQDGKVLSFATDGIDTAEAVNEVLNADTRQELIDLNRGLLEEQSRTFYSGIIHAIDENATVSFEFVDNSKS